MLFQSLLSRYQIELKTAMKVSDFMFLWVYLLFNKCHKINFKWSRSYVHSPDWIKNKKSIMHHINKKVNNCYQYAVIVTLNHEEIGKHPERITKIKPVIDKDNWEEINYPK